MKNKSKNKLNSQRAITLIALVVTIVVLLILAGVSLSLVIGNNGIINKAQQAKVETRAGTVEDEVNLWKTDNYLADNTNGTAETDGEMIARLQKNNLLTSDDEIDAVNKKIIIKKKDGTVVRTISYKYVKEQMYKVGNIIGDTGEKKFISLLNKNDNKPTTFTKAFIVYNNEKIDISSKVISNDTYCYIKGFEVAEVLQEKGKVEDMWTLSETTQTFIIEKDNVEYTGQATMIFVK